MREYFNVKEYRENFGLTWRARNLGGIGKNAVFLFCFEDSGVFGKFSIIEIGSKMQSRVKEPAVPNCIAASGSFPGRFKVFNLSPVDSP